MFYGIEIYLKRFKRVRTISWTIATCFPCDLPPVMAAQKINEVLHLGKQKKGRLVSRGAGAVATGNVTSECGDVGWTAQGIKSRAGFYAACITLGLEAIHTKNVTHRDLKPGNLLMDEGGYLKIAEFGMSKTDIGYGDQANTMVGSPAYMAPEIVKEEEYTRAVDWWALGVIVYEMLLGTRPFTGYDRDFIYDSIVEDEPHYPLTLDSEALSFISQLLNKNPEERLGPSPGDAADVAEHPFFNLLFVPSLNGPEDAKYFEDEFTNQPANRSVPKGPQAEIGKGDR
ncbi:hypothetical protein XELAEV_18041752mg [Xenopus laevis]|uniref:Protein kinase domain-containing protein n=1 Tax=Xenopus laevis TaxID=8355 RepID=A0A974C2T8_XENLA|nr:hypothetical protein XELAEV_18041752mg [Xenopus laevis]